MSVRSYRVPLADGMTTGYGWTGTVHLRRHGEPDAVCGSLLLTGYIDAGTSLDDVRCGACLRSATQRATRTANPDTEETQP